MEPLPRGALRLRELDLRLSFSEELLQEWDWQEHYAGQPETERYLNYVADKFDLRRDIRFNARVASAVFDEGVDHWQVHLEDGHRARAQFLISAVVLSAHYIPDFAGLESFQGAWCHTGRWPAEGMDLVGKRLGVIGTGATGVQLITEIAKEVGHLTVFQRTANYCAPLRNGPIDPETQRQIKASYPDIFKRCNETAGSFIHQFDRRSALAVSPEERLEQYERLWAEPGFKKWPANFYDVMIPGGHEDYAASCGRRFASASRIRWWRKNSCPRTICSAPSASPVRAGIMRCTTRTMSYWLMCARPRSSASRHRHQDP